MKRPVDAHWPISQRFGERPEYYDKYGYAGHAGVDFAPPPGDYPYTNVYAAEEGDVLYAIPDDPSAGGFIHLHHHPAGLQTRYLHNSQLLVSSGEHVVKGQLIAVSGGVPGAYGSGLSTGPHSHFEVIDPAEWGNGYKGRVDPELYCMEDDVDKAVIANALNVLWGWVHYKNRLPKKGIAECESAIVAVKQEAGIQ